MRARTALVAAACLAGACQTGENIPTQTPGPDGPVTTAGINTTALAAAETTGASVAQASTTTEPAPTTTLAPEPILCPQLSHPQHHDNCPVVTTLARVSRQQLPTPPARSSSATLASIRACESGGDYTAVSPNGLYYGAYQFHPDTWASVGGSGNPAAASPAEQDMRAQMMLDAGRRGEWPNC